uniref:Uncharacterized protein n=1 Tax=Anser cygnoides TaxID=8845 RepID=A0A8B9IQE2_ANSCY
MAEIRVVLETNKGGWHARRLPLLQQQPLFKYFIYILSPIYICTAKRAKHLQKSQILHTVCMSIFAFFSQTAKLSHCFHVVSLICQEHRTPSISKKRKSKLNSNCHVCIFLWGEKKSVSILDITLFISKER